MTTTHFSSAVADIPTGGFGNPFRPLTRDSHIDSTNAEVMLSGRPGFVGGGIAIPWFLTSRVGQNWNQIMAELREATSSDDQYHKLTNGLKEFVETSVISDGKQPRHGSGLLAGQPLTIGWRRRLYVCPASGQLRWIPSPQRVKEPVCG